MVQVRSLLLFLTEKLPRTEEDVVQGTELPITVARRQIGEAIRQKMDKKNKVFGYMSTRAGP